MLRLILLSLCLVSLNSFSTSVEMLTDEVQEGFDRQSPAEIEAARRQIEKEFGKATEPSQISALNRDRILALYGHLDPNKEVPSDLLEEAVLYFAANQANFPNQAYITIVDFEKRSNLQRFFLVNMATGEVEKYRTTHGINSDKNNNGFAESFGNVMNSGKSSLGFMRTAEVYYGKYRRSLRLDGLSATNSNVRARAIVFHGWDNVKEENRIQGRSWGCITLDWTLKDGVLDKIKEGSLMFVGVAKK